MIHVNLDKFDRIQEQLVRSERSPRPLRVPRVKRCRCASSFRPPLRSNYGIIGAAFMVLARLDRLAKQLEAVNADIKAELPPNELRAREILSEWREARQEAAKEARQFWIFWGIVAVLVVGWTIMRH